MLFILLTYTFILIEFSLSNQCPSGNYCTCSGDLTSIKCTNRQITDEILLKLNNQFPSSTIILNLSSNSLTSIKSLSNLNSLQILDLSFNKIRYLPWNIFSKFPQLTSLYIQNNSIKTFPKKHHNQSIDNLLEINPGKSQIVYENEQFILNCSSNSKHYWTFNNKFYPSTRISPTYSTIIINHLQLNHSGIWTCHNFNLTRSVSVTVLQNSSHYFCQSIQMNTSKGYFYWPRTLINKKIEKKCPFGSAAWLNNSNDYPRAWYTCSSNGQWKNFDISQCGFQTNISQIFDLLSLNETNLLLNLFRYLSKINRNQMILDDILLLIDLIDEQQEKYQDHDRIMLIYHLTDFILQIKNDFTLLDQYQFAMIRLRLIIERLLDFTDQSWLYIGRELTSMTIQSSLSTKLCFVPNRSLLTIICHSNYQHSKLPQTHLAILQLPSHSNTSNQHTSFRIIVYRQSTLYTSEKTKSHSNNPVIYIRPVSRNNISTIKMIFSTPSDQVSFKIWNTNETAWQMKSSICTLDQQNKNFISTECILLNNKSLSITYFNSQKHFFNRKYSQFIISLSSIIGSICFLITIFFYIYFHQTSQIPRELFHCSINYWLSLAVLLPLFAFGIHRNQYPFLCQFIAISLHFFCLTTIFWLTLITYSTWRKIYLISTERDHHRKSSSITTRNFDDELSIETLKSKFVIHFYILTYGISLTVCGINVIISREQYMINKICFFNNFNSILLLFIPILICIFLIIIFLFLGYYYLKRISYKTSQRKSNENLPILIPLNPNSTQSSSLSTVNYPYESMDYLLSILLQLILLLFLFLSILSIYFHPLDSLKLPFEHLIYSHIYGFFVLFLAFYILSFHIFSRLHRKSKDHLISLRTSIINKESDFRSLTDQLSILQRSQSHYSSHKRISQLSENTIIHNDHASNENYSINLPSDSSSSSSSSSENLSQEIVDMHQSKRSINIPIEICSTKNKNNQLHLSSPSFTQPCQAIIRSLPIIRYKPENFSNSNDHNRSSRISTDSTETYYVLNNTKQSIQEEICKKKTSMEDKFPYDYAKVSYIDEDDEHSLSLKSSISNSKTCSCTTSNKKTHSHTLISSSSSSSSSLLNFSMNQIIVHESSV